jgi:uncharacterized protein YebE (UPF0316 family)
VIELLQGHTWILLCAIFLSRIADQTLDTMRTISIFRGYRVAAVLLGFLVVLIWINVAGQVLTHLTEKWYLGVVYAAGFAAGQATGMWLESKIAMGHQLVRIISKREVDMAAKLWAASYPVTEVEGKFKDSLVDIVFVAERRQRIPQLCEKIMEIDPGAFYTVEEVKRVGWRKREPENPWWLPVWKGVRGLIRKNS